MPSVDGRAEITWSYNYRVQACTGAPKRDQPRLPWLAALLQFDFEVPLLSRNKIHNVLLLHFMICHSKNAIDPAPQDVIKTTRWNNIRDAIGMHKM
jgi:hypothetical protein